MTRYFLYALTAWVAWLAWGGVHPVAHYGLLAAALLSTGFAVFIVWLVRGFNGPFL